MSQRMSVTQGLAELKLLDKRIQKHVGSRAQEAHQLSDGSYGFIAAPAEEGSTAKGWIAVRTKSTPVDERKLAAEAQADWQSFADLVARRDRIKKAIVLSNATTRVKIGAWEGTVAEAIEQKASIQYKKRMIAIGKKELTRVAEEYKAKQAEVQTRLDRLLQSELGKDVRTNPDTIQAITASFLENNKVEIVDPLHLADKVKRLEEEVEEFETNVDWTLSQANGTAMIDM